MKTPLILSEEDTLCLHSILKHQSPGPKPTQEQKTALQSILRKAIKPPSLDDLDHHVGFHDRVSLVSPTDSRDYFNLQIVMPADADPDQEMISVLLPVSLAIIGHRCGENVSWEGPQGPRLMRVIAVEKAAQHAS